MTSRSARCIALMSVMLVAGGTEEAGAADLPQFGKDTVLVWKNENQEDLGNVVVRIAQFLPDRYVEWENSVTQGTIFMPAKSVQEARTFLNSRLFEAGMDMKGNGATTLWLSTGIFTQLKSKPKVKVSLDSVDGWMYPEGVETLPVEVNRVTTEIPVLKVRDDRGSVRWFIDSTDNPLLVKHVIRTFTQTLISISTDRANTLRWIKGKKLPPAAKP